MMSGRYASGNGNGGNGVSAWSHAAGFERRRAEALAKAINHGDERAAMKADLEAAIATLILAAKLR